MNRLKFFYNAGLVGIATLIIPSALGCNSPTEPTNEKPGIAFDNNGSDTSLTSAINSSAQIIKSSAVDKKAVTIGVGATILTIVPVDNKIKLSKTNGDEIFIRFGTIKASPSIILEKANGTIIQESSIVPTIGESWSPQDWLAKAVLVLAAALAIWLGATIVKLVVSAIAFVAMNILILSVIVSAGLILLWLLEKTGWSFDGLLEIVRNGTDWIKDLLRTIIISLP
jgi:hypothetical protein